MCTSYFIEPVQWMEQAMLGVMDGQVTQSPVFSEDSSTVKSARTDSSEIRYFHQFNSGVTLLFYVFLCLAVVSQV